MFIDDNQDKNITCGRVCIKSKIKSLISEVFQDTINGQEYNVQVYGFSRWILNFDVVEIISNHDNVGEGYNTEKEDEEGVSVDKHEYFDE